MSSHYIDAIYAVTLDGEGAYQEIKAASGLSDEQISCIGRSSVNMLLEAGGSSNCFDRDGKRERRLSIQGFDFSMRRMCISAAYIPGGMTKYKTSRSTPMKLIKDARAAYTNAIPLEDSGINTNDLRLDLDKHKWEELQATSAWPVLDALHRNGFLSFEMVPYYGTSRTEIVPRQNGALTISVNAYIQVLRVVATVLDYNYGFPCMRSWRSAEIERSLQNALMDRKAA